MGNGKSGVKKKKIAHNFDYHPGHLANEKNDAYFGENSNYNDWKDNITPDEAEAIKHFTGGGYVEMNKNLYSDFADYNELSGFTKQNAYQLQKVLNKFELNSPIVVKRATSKKLLIGDADISTLEGKTLVFDGFMSTSAAKSPAFDDNVWITINVPEGKGIGAWVGSMSQHKTESEFLMNAGTALKFGKPVKVGSGWDSHWEVTAEYVGKLSKIPTKGKKKK